MTKSWKHVFCGDIIRLDNDQAVPADLVILTTSDEKGLAYVETKNLDGETNLKEKMANKTLLDFFTLDHHLFSKFRELYGTIECEPPNNQIYKFDGAI